MTQTTPSMGTTTANKPTNDPVARQAAIENALSMALWHIRHGDTAQALQSATGRAIRAASLLKQACSETNIGRA